MLVGFTVGIYVARQLGPEQYGTLNYAINFAGIFSVLVSFGLDSILVRELVAKKVSEEEILGTSAILRLLSYGLMLIGVGCGLMVSGDVPSTRILIIIISLGYSFQIMQGLEAYFQSGVMVKYVVWSQLLALFVVAVFRVYFAYDNFPLCAFAMLESIFLFLVFCGLFFFYLRSGKRVTKWRFNFKYAIFLIKESWLLLLSSVFVILYMRIDQIIIKHILGDEAVGNYSAMNRLVELWYFVPLTVCTSLFPSIIAVRDYSGEKYRERLLLLYSAMVWSGIALFLAYCFWGKWLVQLLYGVKYTAGSDLIGWYSLLLITTFFGVVRSRWLIVEGIQKYSLMDSAVILTMLIALNLWLLPVFGLFGSVLAAVVASISGTLIFPLFFAASRKSSIMFFKVLLIWTVFLPMIRRKCDQ